MTAQKKKKTEIGYSQRAKIVTVHMCVSSPLSETTNIDLLEKIVSDQRQILMSVFDESDVTNIPQVWALCALQTDPECTFFSFVLADKEVIGYYEDGMRVPEDITLLWSDDK